MLAVIRRLPSEQFWEDFAMDLEAGSKHLHNASFVSACCSKLLLLAICYQMDL